MAVKAPLRVTHNPVYGGRIIKGFCEQYTEADELSNPNLLGWFHSGLDIKPLYAGLEVRPFADGQVWYARRVPYREDWIVIIKHRVPGLGAVFGRYSHLAAGGVLPKRWQHIKMHDRIGLVDPIYGHLHFDLMRFYNPLHFAFTAKQVRWYYVDPTPWVTGTA